MSKPGNWLIAGEDKCFVYALGPKGTNTFWARVEAAGPERVSDEERAAIARLIASAPDLYEALKRYVAWADVTSTKVGEMKAMRAQMNAAIAKAEGK